MNECYKCSRLAELVADNNALLAAKINYEELITDMFLTWKRLDIEGDWPYSGHNGYRVFEQRLKQLNLID